ncbi:hypothetical protein [Microbacterium sp. SA39]|uniref:hypothetical protein n=1 Tax=Microbacterium sp. SA39 TaxID=1263625 RepID=UPI00126A5196|nr:hypothetical protein [Microbacterium sp. SA39]
MPLAAPTVSGTGVALIQSAESIMHATEIVDLSAPVEPAEAVRAAAEFRDLDVIVRSVESKAKVWQGSDGRWWRSGGYVYLFPGRDGVMRFSIYLRRGANESDYEWLCGIVESAKSGALERHGWDAYSSARGSGWTFTGSRSFGNPLECVDDTKELIACEDNRCRRTVHDASGDFHIADDFDHDTHAFEVSRSVDRDTSDEVYTVYARILTDEPLTPAAAVGMASDLQWAAESARRANAAPIDSRTKGMRDPSSYWERRNALEQETNH